MEGLKIWGRVVMCGHNLSILVEISLTDLPKSGRGVRLLHLPNYRIPEIVGGLRNIISTSLNYSLWFFQCIGQDDAKKCKLSSDLFLNGGKQQKQVP